MSGAAGGLRCECLEASPTRCCIHWSCTPHLHRLHTPCKPNLPLPLNLSQRQQGNIQSPVLFHTHNNFLICRCHPVDGLVHLWTLIQHTRHFVLTLIGILKDYSNFFFLFLDCSIHGEDPRGKGRLHPWMGGQLIGGSVPCLRVFKIFGLKKVYV